MSTPDSLVITGLKVLLRLFPPVLCVSVHEVSLGAGYQRRPTSWLAARLVGVSALPADGPDGKQSGRKSERYHGGVVGGGDRESKQQATWALKEHKLKPSSENFFHHLV